MPSLPSDDQAPARRWQSPAAGDSPGEKRPRSRTGKFFQGMFGKKEKLDRTDASAFDQSPTFTTMPRVDKPPQELIQVVPEPTDWGDDEESNWDDDFMDEPVAPVPPPPPPSTFNAHSSDLMVESEPPLEIEKLESEPLENQDFESQPLEVDRPIPPPPVESVVASVPDVEPVVPPRSPEPLPQPTPAGEAVPISVNIPRPKNIKYKTKSSQSVDVPVPELPPDKAAAVELNIKRPTAVKYKTKPVTQPSLIDRIIAPGKSLWQKIPTPALPNLGDLLPTQLLENPKKILGLVAAVLLAIVTTWGVVNFWPSTNFFNSSVSSNAAVVEPSNPAETLITAVKSQLNTLASQYPAGLIVNLELNNDRQLAIVTLGSLWGSLSEAQRQQVAQSLWQQSRNYQMSQIELRSEAGNLLARSPIVGQDMVILASW